MDYFALLFVITALSGAVLWGVLAIWAFTTGLRGRKMTYGYGLALLAGEVTLGLLLAVELYRWLAGALAEFPALALMYGLLAMGITPAVWFASQEQQPRQVALSVSLACLFASAVAIRALQTGI